MRDVHTCLPRCCTLPQAGAKKRKKREGSEKKDETAANAVARAMGGGLSCGHQVTHLVGIGGNEREGGNVVLARLGTVHYGDGRLVVGAEEAGVRLCSRALQD